MNKILKALIRNNQLDELLKHRLSRKTIQIFFVHCAGIALAVGSNLWIAKVLHTSGYGQYSFLITLVNLMASFACLGFSSSLVRDVPAYLIERRLASIKGLTKFAYSVTFLVSLLFGAIFIGVVYAGFFPFVIDGLTVIAVIVSVVLSALIFIRQFILQGLGNIFESQIVNNLIRYIILVALLAGVLFFTNTRVEVNRILLLFGISIGLAYLFMEAIYLKTFPAQVKINKAEYQPSVWIKTSLALFTYKLLSTYLMSSEIILLGYLGSDEEVGIYSMARKVAGFASFGLLAGNIVIAPKIAGLNAEGKMAELQSLIRKSIRIIFVFCLIVSLFLTIISFPVLEYLGHDYKKAYLPMLIMIFGELMNVAFGPVALLLINSKQEKAINRIMFITVLFNVVSTIVLIHFFRYTGAAISTAMSVILWNVLMALTVKRKIGINSWI